MLLDFERFNFPVTEYEEMHRLVIKRNSKAPIDSTIMSQFQGGWNAVAYRFRATADHDKAFTDAIKRAADAQVATDNASAFENKHSLSFPPPYRGRGNRGKVRQFPSLPTAGIAGKI